MKYSKEFLERLDKLQEKYEAMGQDMESYLEGLLYADYLTYWDYVNLDTLLSLQEPRTPIPDERIFIIYHQITELYFKLTLQAIEQAVAGQPDANLLKRQLKRLNRYFTHLVDSFSIMVDGMDQQEFLQFRMSLLPASGFQSVQYRMIEIWSTNVYHLLHYSARDQFKLHSPVEEMYQHLYWKRGATELATGKKTLTLRQFEAKYGKKLIGLAEYTESRNLWVSYQCLSQEERSDAELIELMREYDLNVTVRWSLAHFRSAARYLNREVETIEATGGTNWQKYLPPKYQRIFLFPDLWSEEERASWGTKVK